MQKKTPKQLWYSCLLESCLMYCCRRLMESVSPFNQLFTENNKQESRDKNQFQISSTGITIPDSLWRGDILFLNKAPNVVCVCSMWFFSSEKKCYKPDIWMCWGSRWGSAALIEDFFESCSWDTTLQKLLWEKHSKKELLAQKCAYLNYVALNDNSCEWD